MSSRISCWIRGHRWGPAGRRIYTDVFGNLWRLRLCDQCGASQRRLHRAWSER